MKEKSSGKFSANSSQRMFFGVRPGSSSEINPNVVQESVAPPRSNRKQWTRESISEKNLLEARGGIEELSLQSSSKNPYFQKVQIGKHLQGLTTPTKTRFK